MNDESSRKYKTKRYLVRWNSMIEPTNGLSNEILRVTISNEKNSRLNGKKTFLSSFGLENRQVLFDL